MDQNPNFENPEANELSFEDIDQRLLELDKNIAAKMKDENEEDLNTIELLIIARALRKLVVDMDAFKSYADFAWALLLLGIKLPDLQVVEEIQLINYLGLDLKFRGNISYESPYRHRLKEIFENSNRTSIKRSDLDIDTPKKLDVLMPPKPPPW